MQPQSTFGMHCPKRLNKSHFIQIQTINAFQLFEMYFNALGYREIDEFVDRFENEEIFELINFWKL